MAQTNGTIRALRTNKTSKVIELLSLNPNGLSASQISEKLNIPRRTAYNSLVRLQNQHKAINIRPLWIMAQTQAEYQNCATSLHSNSLHYVSFLIRLIQKPFWWNNRHNKLIRLKEYQIKKVDWGNNPYTQLMDDAVEIHLFKHTIVFKLKKEYTGNDVWDCYLQAQDDFLKAYQKLESTLQFQFFKEGVPQAELKSQHHVLKDEFAKRCTKSGRSFQVAVNGKVRVLIDLSHPKGIEGISTEYSQDDIDYYQDFVKDLITNRPNLPSDTQSKLDRLTDLTLKITENQAVFDANMASHIAAVQKLGGAVEELVKTIKELKKE